MAVEATTLVEFGDVDPASVLVVLELDNILNVDSEGNNKTSFAPGDDIFFRLQVSSGVVIEDIIPTDGTVQNLGAVSRSSEETTVFLSREADNPTKKTLSYIPNGSISITYIGRSGSVSRAQKTNLSVEYTGDINSVPFLAEFTYNYNIGSYVLRTPNIELTENESYPIVIVVYLNTPPEEINDGCNS